MKEQIIKNLKDDKGLSPEQLIYLMDNMIKDDEDASVGDVRYELTKWLMQNQYKSF